MAIKKDNNITVSKVISGGFWLYVDITAVSLIGYLYWVLIGIITGPTDGASIIGYATTTVSLSWIIQTATTFGVPVGIQRFLGKAFGENNYEIIKCYFIPAFLFVSFITLVAALGLFLFNFFIIRLLKLDIIYIIFAGLLVFLSGVNAIFKSFLVSTLKTKNIFIYDTITQIVRLISGIYFVMIGFNGVGAVLGIVFSNVTLTIVLTIYTFNIMRPIRYATRWLFHFNVIKKVLNASIVNWIPQIITVLGTQLGILVLFSNQGAASTGIYYVAYAIFSIVLAFPNAFLSLLLPVLSGIEKGRVNATRRVINVMLAVSGPLVAILFVYSSFILNLFGFNYMTSALILSILVLSIPFFCVVNGVRNLIYASGKYKSVLILGSAMSITRIVFYIILVPIWNGVGTAIAFDLGLVIAFFVAIHYSAKYNLNINLLAFTASIVFPITLSVIPIYFNVPWYIGSLFILLASELIFARIGLYTKDDIKDLSIIIFPESFLKYITPKVHPIIKILFGE